MKIGYKLPFLTFILLLMSGTLLSQKRWNLQECVEFAINSNADMRLSTIEIEQRENLLNQNRFNYLPTINSSINHSFNWGRSVNLQNLEIIHNKLSQATSANLGASLTLFEGNIKKYSYSNAKVDFAISKHQFQKRRDDIVIEVIRAYLQLLLAQELLELSQLNLQESQKEVERTVLLVEAGSAPLSTRLEIEAQRASDKVAVVDAKNGVEEAKLHLELLLNLPEGEEFTIAPIEIEKERLPIPSVDDLMMGAERLPQLEIATLNVERAQNEYSIAKGRLYPTIHFSAGYGTFFSDGREEKFFDQFNENRNPSVGLGLTIPILNNLSARTSVKNSKLSVEGAKIELIESRKQLRNEVKREHRVLLSQWEKIVAGEANVTAMRESFSYIKSRFNLGMVKGTDYSLAKSNLFKAESELLQSQYQYLLQLKVVDLFLGRALFSE